ncbi:ImmA/IrrE family metallo-endopeptidase [Clostridium butyricum]
MGTNEIIEFAKEIRNIYHGESVIDVIRQNDIAISFTNLNPKMYPAYTINTGKTTAIILNNHFNVIQQNILAAHELGHILLHDDKIINQFGGDNEIQEYEANLFAVALLFDENEFNVKFNKLTNYELKYILDHNIKFNS